ncbi:MAG TPA: erythromycin esterase family protein [Kiritimatiellia bacterium]|nr:erythromycin esterase family protein [Kiritimatiellia bacterium]HMP00198.1 erythromycin esterase family protein [Kiritimatiellia bacterium]
MKTTAWPHVVTVALALFPGLVCADQSEGDHPVAHALRTIARPLDGPDGLPTLVQQLAGSRLVMLGEASHGTSEFYTLRDQITRRLVEDHGFRFVAVEGDWNAIYRLNRYVKGPADAGASARTIMQTFTRWPQWMWANEETLALVEWLRAWNAGRPPAERAGFYGIDVYGHEDALRKLPGSIAGSDEDRAARVGEHIACLLPFAADLGEYARAAHWGMASCTEAAKAIVDTLRENREAWDIAADEYLHLKQMAYVIQHAERHYRAMARGGADSWNARVDHFFHTVERLMAHYGDDARGIVWAHNTHIGDARATPMAGAGQRNIGQMARDRWGRDQVAAVGFATHRGEVLAGRAWGGEREPMIVPSAGPGTLEDFLAQMGLGDAWLDLRNAPEVLGGPIGHRAIGVIYHPEHEFPGNYVPTILSLRYDALIFVEVTSTLQFLPTGE